MQALMIQCTTCGTLFSPGIVLGGNATVHLQGNMSQCPSCGSIEHIPDGTFKNTVEGIVKILNTVNDPVQTLKQVIKELEQAKQSNNVSDLDNSQIVSPFQKWIPNTPEKLAAYIAIFYTIYLLLSQQPNITIEYNQQFINQYNLIMSKNMKTTQPIKKKIRRNELCPCGSGKKYKKCCLLKHS
jgi:hypothetical protein